MSEQEEMGLRLRWARRRRGVSTDDAARALSIGRSTFTQYENGRRNFSRYAKRFARFFRVRLVWLTTGRGDPFSETSEAIPIMGYVGAGATVDPINHAADAEFPLEIDLPGSVGIAALIVKGDSQYPRFRDGEVLLYETEPRKPQDLLNQYAVVTALDGRILIKILRDGGRPGFFRLESHNAPPEDCELMAAQRYVGLLAPAAPLPAIAKRPRRQIK